MKIKIGENEIETPVRAEFYETNLEVLLLDANNQEVKLNKPAQADIINELASLQQRVEELEQYEKYIKRKAHSTMDACGCSTCNDLIRFYWKSQHDKCGEK